MRIGKVGTYVLLVLLVLATLLVSMIVTGEEILNANTLERLWFSYPIQALTLDWSPDG